MRLLGGYSHHTALLLESQLRHYWLRPRGQGSSLLHASVSSSVKMGVTLPILPEAVVRILVGV